MVPANPKSISPKVNVIAQLEFKLAYYDVQQIGHYVIGLPRFSSIYGPLYMFSNT